MAVHPCRYFTEPQIVESLIAALQIKPKLQLILVVNNYVDTRYYHKLQNDAIEDLLKKAKDVDAHLRVGVFTAWVLYSGGLPPCPPPQLAGPCNAVLTGTPAVP